MAKAMVYVQSGGPTSVINTSFYGAIIEARKHPDRISNIYGSRYGIEGLINDHLIDVNQESLEDIELLKQTPGAILGTTRYKLPKDYQHPIYLKIIDTLKKHNVGYLFINGGNDSMDTCNKLTQSFKENFFECVVFGVPKTIDNDLACTDHSLGFPSAAKHVMATVGSIVIDSQCYKKGKVVVIEIMGRNAGWLTAAPDLLPDHTRPDLFYLPEKPFVLESFLNDVKLIYAKQGYVVACVSEGLTFPRDNQNARLDSFGHIQLGGAAHDLVGIVEKTLDLPTRAIELSLPQRSNEVLISKVDQDEALAIGKMAVQEAINGVYGKMISITRLSTDPYEVKLELVPLDLIANEERIVPASMFLNKHEMSKEYRDYLRPLVMGEIAIKYENGVPKTSHFKYHKVVA